MAHVVLMPQPGNTVESCVIVAWRKAEGDEVSAGDPLCDVETDKAVFEVNAEADGVLLKTLYPEGEDVPVLKPLAVIGAAGEDVTAVLASAGAAAPTAPSSAKPAQGPAAPAQARASPPKNVPSPASPSADRGGADSRPSGAISPRARALASREGISAESLSGTGPEGRIIERDILAGIAARPSLSAAAKAAVVSRPAGIPAEGKGIGGRVLLSELTAFAESPAILSRGAPLPFPGSYRDEPMKGVRKLTAQRMRESLVSTAQFTLNASADASRLLEFRKRLKESPEGMGLKDATINDIVLFAVSRILPAFPYMNAHKLGDTVRVFDSVHLGNAVDTPRGLLVPVVRNADSLSLAALSRETRRLADACREGRAKPDELSGSGFTLTNLGGLGVESFTPVINIPEVAILGVCAIREEVGSDGRGGLRLKPRLGLSLTIDHQAVDGAPAARFLKALCEAIAEIDLVASA